MLINILRTARLPVCVSRVVPPPIFPAATHLLLCLLTVHSRKGPGFCLFYEILGSESGQISVQPSLLSLKRHCSHPLTHHVLQPSDDSVILFSVCQCLFCITEPQNRHRTPGAFPKHQTDGNNYLP